MEGEVSGNMHSIPSSYHNDIKEERHALRCICCLSRNLSSTPAVLMPFLAKRIFNHEPVEITSDWGLRDLRLGMAYTLCNTLECEECGVIFLDYRFSDQELELLYRDYRGPEYTALRSSFEPGYTNTASHYQGRTAYIDSVEEFLAPHLSCRPKVLDWGGDSGINSPFRFLASPLHIYDISGVETCNEAMSVSFQECLEQSYDLIVCSQVLEHVSFPILLLQQITSLLRLRPQTLLYLEVPMEEIFQSESTNLTRGSSKRHWHEHINFFSPSSLLALANICGLEVVDSNTMQFSLGWKQATVQMLLCRIASSEDESD
jgi:hypothetical protein